METWLKIIKQYGVTGLLTIWLFITHTKVQQLEARLYDCFEDRTYRNYQKDINSKQSFAIIPKDYISEKIKKLRG